MTRPSTTVAPPRPSTRATLARLALDAALGVDGVVAGHRGPSGAHVSVAEGGNAVGVVAAARPGGRFDLSLALVARPVSLHRLADAVRGRIGDVVSRAGLGDTLGQIDVAFEDLLEVAPDTPPEV